MVSNKENRSHLSTLLTQEEEKLLACVHCGLCLEACPTYVHTGDENDSPRGRIYLMNAVEEGRLSPSSRAFERHINRCLGCRACEQACPAGVQYGQLLEAARSVLYNSEKKRSHENRPVSFILTRIWLHPRRLRLALNAARLFRDSRLASLLVRSRIPRLLSSRLHFALMLLDSSSPVDLHSTENEGEKDPLAKGTDPPPRSRALLFAGCVMDSLFRRVNKATIRVLQANNCETSLPANQRCCGALHAHSGDLEGARRLARQNIEAFEDRDRVPIITNAGGCGAMLVSYVHLLEDDPEFAERAVAFSARVLDISQQLESIRTVNGEKLADKSVTYDASCHLLYGQKAVKAPLAMLERIPSLRFTPLAGSEVCCGGAGIYNLLETDLSASVFKEKLRHIEECGAELLATGNPGCHMQIAAGAKLGGISLRVCHPVEMLDESYRRAGLYR